MSAVVSAREMVAAAAENNEQLQHELARIAEKEREHQAARKQLADELESAWQNLTSQVVHSLDAAALDDAARRIRLPAISASQVFERASREKAEIEARLARLQADPLLVNRDAKLTEISVRLRELEEFIEPLHQGVSELDSTPVFKELIASGYGTPRYTAGWWTLSYYRHWKHADLAVEKFAKARGVSDFAELRRKYEEEALALKELRARESKLKGEKQHIDETLALCERQKELLLNLPEQSLLRTRTLVREHLQNLPVDDRVKLMSGVPALELAAKRIAGVEAKQRYLDNMLEEYVRKPRADLEKLVAKNKKDIQKLSRPKNSGKRFPRADYDRRFRDRGASWNKRWSRYDDARNRIVVFHDYHRYDPVSDFLWWDVMTDGRLDGDFIPEVHHFHSSHPHWHHDHHHDAAVAAVADESHDTSPDRFSDAS